MTENKEGFQPDLTKAPGDEEAPKPPTKISLVIEWDTLTGGIDVKGPVANKTVCYGMLKMAEKLIDGYMSPAQANAQKGIIQRIMGNGSQPGFRGFKGH